MLDWCACVGVTVHISKIMGIGGLQSCDFDDVQNSVGGAGSGETLTVNDKKGVFKRAGWACTLQVLPKKSKPHRI